MSDSSQGPGWWQASDGKWYPPEALDQTQAIPTQPQPQSTYTETTTYAAPPPVERSGLRPWHLIAAAVLSWLIGVVMGAAIGGASDDDDADDVAVIATSTTEATTTTAATTTTTVERTTTTEPPPTTAAPKQFVEVTRLSGTTEKRGEVFELTSSQSRMRYESTADVLGVYIVEEGDSLEESGGFTEVTCTEPCNDTTQLAKRPGRYYLEVKSSGGAWTVIIEELR